MQPDGVEGTLLTAFFILSLLFGLLGSMAIVVGVCKNEFPQPALWFIPLCLLPVLFIGSWIYYSVQGVKETAHVDELYYFDLQHLKDKDGKDVMVFYDNRGRFLYADRFGNPDDTLVARKRVFRGRSLLISWEWMEFDLVPRPVGRDDCSP